MPTSSRQSASSTAKAVNQQIVFRVVGAYQSVLYAQREIDVAQHNQETAVALLSSVKDHVKAGLAVDSDRMSAEVNLAARKEELIAAQGIWNWRGPSCARRWETPDLKAFRPEAD